MNFANFLKNTFYTERLRAIASVKCFFSNKLYYWLYVLVMSRTRFRVNPHSIVAWISRNSLPEAGAKSEG